MAFDNWGSSGRDKERVIGLFGTGRTQMNKIKIRFLSQFWPALLALVIVSSWAMWGEVIWLAKGDTIKNAGGAVLLNVSAYKLRNCEIIPNSALGYVRSDGKLWEEASIKFIADKSPNSNRPRILQRQSFGVWEWTWEHVDQTAKEVMVTVVHRCNNKMRLTRIGPMETR